MKQTVSVVIPAYNCEKYVAAAIESARRQTAPNLEIIVVNDGSTDSTLDIVTALADLDDRIKVLSQPSSGRPASARNAGVRASSGEFVCFLDADDLLFPAKVEKQLALFRSYPHLNIAFHDVKNLYDSGEEDSGSYLGRAGFPGSARDYMIDRGNGVYLCKENFYNFMSAYCTTVAIQNVMVRRSALDALDTWFPEDMTIGEDIDLWFRLALTNPMVCILEPLSYYRRHDSNITNDLQGYFKGSLEVHEKNLLRGADRLTPVESHVYRRKIAVQHFHYGYYLYRNKEVQAARQEYLSSLRLSPCRKALSAYLKTFVPAGFIHTCRQYLRPNEG